MSRNGPFFGARARMSSIDVVAPPFSERLGVVSKIAVSFRPGRTSATRTPCRCHSMLSASVKPLTACLVAEYTAIRGIPYVADEDDVENIRLPGRFFRCGRDR